MNTDTDEPREYLPGWLDLVAWIPAFWQRVLEGLHRWLHKRMPDCSECAKKDRRAARLWNIADKWANECLALEQALAAEQATRAIAPGMPVTDAEIAVATDTLLTGQTPRLPQPKINQIVAEMVGPPGNQAEEKSRGLSPKEEEARQPHVRVTRPASEGVISSVEEACRQVVGVPTTEDFSGRGGAVPLGTVNLRLKPIPTHPLLEAATKREAQP